MKDYNGFSSAQRNRAQRWLNTQWDKGTLRRPIVCVACGQDEGVIDAHAEDYSEPFRAGVTDGYHLCFPCHMMVHCRHRNEERWLEYRRIVEDGHRTTVPFLTRNWGRFMGEFLRPILLPESFMSVQPIERKALYEIELSQDEVAKRLRPVNLPVTL